MKKTFFAVLMGFLCLLPNFAANSADAHAEYISLLEKAKKYEAQKQYAYALGTYWDAMEASPLETEEALDRFRRLALTIKLGNPGYGKFNQFDLHDEWVKLIKNYEKYWSENCPYVFRFDGPTKGGADMSTRTVYYSFDLSAMESRKYSMISECVDTGYKTARTESWHNLFPLYQHKFFTDAQKDGVYTHIDQSLEAYIKRYFPGSIEDLRYSKPTIVSSFYLATYEFSFDVCDKSGNVLYPLTIKSKSPTSDPWIESRCWPHPHLRIKVGGKNLDLFDSNQIQVVPKKMGFYYKYYDYVNNKPEPRQFHAYDLSKLKISLSDQDYDFDAPAAVKIGLWDDIPRKEELVKAKMISPCLDTDENDGVFYFKEYSPVGEKLVRDVDSVDFGRFLICTPYGKHDFYIRQSFNPFAPKSSFYFSEKAEEESKKLKADAKNQGKEFRSHSVKRKTISCTASDDLVDIILSMNDGDTLALEGPVTEDVIKKIWNILYYTETVVGLDLSKATEMTTVNLLEERESVYFRPRIVSLILPPYVKKLVIKNPNVKYIVLPRDFIGNFMSRQVFEEAEYPGTKEEWKALVSSGKLTGFESGDWDPTKKIKSLRLRGDSLDIKLPKGSTAIKSSAYWGRGELVTVSIPYGVKTIGSSAFEKCYGLSNVSMPDTLNNIRDSAFKNCHGLENISIPDGVTNIGSNAFEGCFSLKTFSIPRNVKVISAGTFKGCKALTTVSIPEGVTSIGSEAFSGCASLESISIPSSVTKIAGDAFSDCKSLKKFEVSSANEKFESIDGILYSKGGHSILAYPNTHGPNFSIPEGVTYIGEGAFHTCWPLKSVTIPTSVGAIDDNSFPVDGYYSIVYPGSKGMWEKIRISPTYRYKLSKHLKILEIVKPSDKNSPDFAIPDGTKKVSKDMLGGSANVKVYIPASVTQIEQSAFTASSKLETITVAPENSVYKSIDGVLFSKDGKKVLRYPAKRGGSYTIPAGVTTITANAFSACHSLKELFIPACVRTIEDGAFRECSFIMSVAIPEGVTSIGREAFYKCDSLKKIEIPSSVTSIGDNAFEACPLLEISIPDGVRRIGKNAFKDCAHLSEVSLPATMVEIPTGLFSGCGRLETVTCTASVTKISGDVFDGCSSLKSLVFIGSKSQWKNVVFESETDKKRFSKIVKIQAPAAAAKKTEEKSVPAAPVNVAPAPVAPVKTAHAQVTPTQAAPAENARTAQVAAVNSVWDFVHGEKASKDKTILSFGSEVKKLGADETILCDSGSGAILTLVKDSQNGVKYNKGLQFNASKEELVAKITVDSTCTLVITGNGSSGVDSFDPEKKENSFSVNGKHVYKRTRASDNKSKTWRVHLRRGENLIFASGMKFSEFKCE